MSGLFKIILIGPGGAQGDLMLIDELTVAWFLPPLRVLERIGARALVAHVRTFADFLVYEFSTSAGGQQLNKCIEILNDMVWKYNIVTLDRLILCLVRADIHRDKYTVIEYTSHPVNVIMCVCVLSSTSRQCVAMKAMRHKFATS